MPDTPRLFAATVKVARLWQNAAARAAAVGGLTDALTHFQPANQLAARLGIAPDKRDAFTRLLDLLAAEGMLERAPGPPSLYRRAERRASSGNGLLEPAGARRGVVDGWITAREAERAARRANAMLGSGLGYFQRPGGLLTFTARHDEYWRGHLTNPLYDVARSAAIRAIARPGGRYLDLAGGPGITARALAEACDGPCEITIVDKSGDFLATAAAASYPAGARIRTVHRDLNEGLPPLPAASLDGAVCLGAFHYIRDKPARLAEIHRALRPGATLVIGNCLTLSDYEDQALALFTIALVDEQAYPVTEAELRRMITDAGFQPSAHTIARGSCITVTAVRSEQPAQAA